MSKRLLVFIYVLAVLIFSGFIADAKTLQEPTGQKALLAVSTNTIN